jgi:nicotinamide mononucleotide transporter
MALGWLLDAGWDDALYTYWDASIVAASVVAMLLLSRKKVESWWLWILPVNVSAIGLYLATGAYMFAALYGLFLVMAFVGLARWIRAARVGTT